MYLTLTNSNGFPFASVYCSASDLNDNIYDLHSYVENKGYKGAHEIFISEKEEWKVFPGVKYVGTVYSNGGAKAHVYQENNPRGYYFAIDYRGEKHLGSDRLSLEEKLNEFY